MNQVARLIVPAGQTCVRSVLTPDLAFAEGKGLITIRLVFWNSDDVHRYVLGEVVYAFSVVGGVVCFPNGTPRLDKQTRGPLTAFRGAFTLGLDHRDLVERPTAHEYRMGREGYAQYALLPELWVEAEHSQDVLYTLSLTTETRPMKTGIAGMERV